MIKNKMIRDIPADKIKESSERRFINDEQLALVNSLKIDGNELTYQDLVSKVLELTFKVSELELKIQQLTNK